METLAGDGVDNLFLPLLCEASQFSIDSAVLFNPYPMTEFFMSMF